VGLMADRFDERLATIRLILAALERSPSQWTPLVRKVMVSSTPWLTQTCLEWLLSNGYLERPRRGQYGLTDKGLELLGAPT